MPETEDGLNSLAAAKVKEGGKKMGPNMFMFIKYLLCCQTLFNSFSDHEGTSDTTESGVQAMWSES